MTNMSDATTPLEGTPLIQPSTTEHPLYDNVLEACRTVYDPEIPVNIQDLGLIYTININDENEVKVLMSLTAPGCPVAGEMPGWVADAIEPLAGVKTVDVELVWEPQWGMDMMSDEARLELGFMQSKPLYFFVDCKVELFAQVTKYYNSMSYFS